VSETGSAGSAAPYLSTASVPRAGVGLEPDVTGFYDEPTGSVQYLVADPITRRGAIIDPVLDFDPTSGATRTTSADRLLRHNEARGLTLEWILDTHSHADHFSAAGYLKDVTGAPTAIGERVTEVQKIWKKLYNLPEAFPRRTGRNGIACLQMENDLQLAHWRRGRCYPLVTRCAPSLT
jgi:glyoxylase-like metal-dependent hydrolase (beta-lactamase superfamily II)